MIANVARCSRAELESQIAYLAATPVRAIAAALREGSLDLKKGIVRSLDHLGMLKTEFGRLGPLEP
ncbi:MAG: hypothetical protein HW416_1252, partial [Chloroflexi bacterium]|nr:hypothetical protein [Chloroflexota bacterium]